jgi:saccharopine dehydrogenase-like NADP-dependent oxidoreductase
MKRFLLIGGGGLIAVIAVVLLAARLDSGRVFIAGEQPVSVDQVRQKLVTDGWSPRRTPGDAARGLAINSALNDGCFAPPA